MCETPHSEGLLAPFRVLDLTDDKGYLCGKILGDMGADVIKVEPPCGDAGRSIGPFYHDIPHPEKSLYWLAFNTSKRGITLDIATADGKELLRRLVKTAHFVIESYPPGHLDKLELGYETLRQLNPGIILTSITPFGQSGPYRDYKGPDIVGMAMGGLMYLCGDPDRPPVRISFPQAYLHAAAEAAAATMIAHYHRQWTGVGQQVDVSMQQCVVWTMMNARQFWDLNRVNLRRAGPMRAGLSAQALQYLTWPCQDGAVAFAITGGRAGTRTMQALVEWMDSLGMANDFLKEEDWNSFDMAMASQEEMDKLREALGGFFMAHTKSKLYEGAIKRRVMLYPVTTVKDIAESPQLRARDFWVELGYPQMGAITYPGPFIRSSEAPCRLIRAPSIGEHNEEIYMGELGLSRQELIALKQCGII